MRTNDLPVFYLRWVNKKNERESDFDTELTKLEIINCCHCENRNCYLKYILGITSKIFIHSAACSVITTLVGAVICDNKMYIFVKRNVWMMRVVSQPLIIAWFCFSTNKFTLKPFLLKDCQRRIREICCIFRAPALQTMNLIMCPI